MSDEAESTTPERSRSRREMPAMEVPFKIEYAPHPTPRWRSKQPRTINQRGKVSKRFHFMQTLQTQLPSRPAAPAGSSPNYVKFNKTDRPPERWPSGLRRTLGKRVYFNEYRGFESHSLRHKVRPRRSAPNIIAIGIKRPQCLHRRFPLRSPHRLGRSIHGYTRTRRSGCMLTT